MTSPPTWLTPGPKGLPPPRGLSGRAGAPQHSSLPLGQAPSPPDLPGHSNASRGGQPGTLWEAHSAPRAGRGARHPGAPARPSPGPSALRASVAAGRSAQAGVLGPATSRAGCGAHSVPGEHGEGVWHRCPTPTGCVVPGRAGPLCAPSSPTGSAAGLAQAGTALQPGHRRGPRTCPG